MKMSIIKTGYSIPRVDTFSRLLGCGKRSLANITKYNKISKKRKERHTNSPELDDIVYDFINISESFLSDHGFSLCWSLFKFELCSLQKC